MAVNFGLKVVADQAPVRSDSINASVSKESNLATSHLNSVVLDFFWCQAVVEQSCDHNSLCDLYCSFDL